ncbi:hypothetical protein ABIC83_002859 [Roseateles asaccharophilus]|uniref:HAD domain-containing protein n=1 Tax=Roseateles asaccharophilus TaxID=582607 RepID=UPI003837B086
MKGHGEPVLYLDLDGVGHHEAVYISPKRGIYINQDEAPGRVLFEWIPILVDILRPHHDVKLVLSSSWCRRPGYDRTLKRLPDELRKRFVGGTFHRRHHGADPLASREFQTLPRGQQILNDVKRRQPSDWLALDDDDEGWPADHRGHLIHCNGSLGLSDPVTQVTLALRLAALSRLG